MTSCSLRRAARLSLFTAIAFIAATTMAAAQDTRVPVPHAQTVSANPFGLVVGWFNAEYERKLTESITFGVSGSNLATNGVDVQRGNALFRYYPQGAALTGVYFGGRTGFARLSDEDDSAHAFAAGFEIGYSWLLGSRRNVGISIGGGVDRLFGGDLNGFDLYWPNVRLVNIGIAF